MRVNDIRNKCYPEGKKDMDRIVSLWVYYVIRPASFYATYVAVRARLSPNQATLIGLIVGAISIAMAYMGNMFFAALLLNFFAILDCVDGNLARLSCPSKAGEYYDAVSGDLINFIFPPVFFLSALRDGHLGSLEFLGSENIIIIIITIGFVQILTGLASQRLKLIVGPAVQTEHMQSISLLEIIARNSFGAAFLFPISLIVSIFGGFEILLVYMAISAPVFYMVSVFRVVNSEEKK